jgi:pimeloyl-ACP methyl ester carboxylesterase
MKMLSKIKGNGPPVVLVPGGLTGWISWDPHAERLSTDHKVVQAQLINVEYGYKNQPLPADYSVKTESRALTTTLDDLDLKGPVDFVAWSYGADVTLDFALDHPDRVRTLTLIEPPALWVIKSNGSFKDDVKPTVDMLQKLQGDITDDMLVLFMQSVGLLKPGQKAQDMPQWALWKSYKLSLRNSPAIIMQNDDPARLRTFQSPVLLVKGTGSAKFLHDIIDRLAVYLPHAEVVEFLAGHAPHIVSMDRFLEKLALFQNNPQGK